MSAFSKRLDEAAYGHLRAKAAAHRLRVSERNKGFHEHPSTPTDQPLRGPKAVALTNAMTCPQRNQTAPGPSKAVRQSLSDPAYG